MVAESDLEKTYMDKSVENSWKQAPYDQIYYTLLAAGCAMVLFHNSEKQEISAPANWRPPILWGNKSLRLIKDKNSQPRIKCIHERTIFLGYL